MQLYNGGYLGRANQYKNILQPIYVGGYTISFGSTPTNRTVVLTSLTGGIDTAPSPGDFLIWTYGIAENGTALPSLSASSNEGVLYSWQQFASGSSDSTGSDIAFIGRYSHVTTTLTLLSIGHSALVANSTATSFLLQVWRNIDPINPISGAAASSNLTNSILANPPLQTSTVANSVYVAMAAGGHTAGANALYSNSSLTNFLSSAANSLDSDSVIGGGYILTTSGGLAIQPDSPAFTFSTTNSTSYASRAISILLRPIIAPTGIFSINAARR